MAWIETYTGRQFYPLAPDPEQIDIMDIAHALSMLCRYNGHCQRFYSVAEHSVYCSRAATPEYALELLLHDASEAYISDLTRPVKQQIPEYRAIEKRLDAAIRAKFGLPTEPTVECKRIDDAMLLTERTAMAFRLAWDIPGREALHGAGFSYWPPEKAEREFIHRFYELHG